MADSTLGVVPPADPFGSAVGGFQKGFGIVEAIQNRRRLLQEQHQKDLALAVDLTNKLGAAAIPILKEAGIQLPAAAQAALPTQSMEQRQQALDTIQPEQFNSIAETGKLNTPLHYKAAEGIGSVLKGVAANASAENVNRAKAGDIEWFKSRATNLTQELDTIRRSMGNVTLDPMAQAQLTTQLNAKQKELDDNNWMGQVAASVRSKTGSFIGKYKGANLPSQQTNQAAAQKGNQDPYDLIYSTMTGK